jgi:hypothetical protein
MLDPAVMIWNDLSIMATGEIPSPRDSVGMTSIDTKIYIFGGIFRKGALNLSGLGKFSYILIWNFFFS